MELLLTAPVQMTLTSLRELGRRIGFGVVFLGFCAAFLVTAPVYAARIPAVRRTARILAGLFGYAVSKKVRRKVNDSAARWVAKML